MIDNISGQLIYDILLLKRKKYGGNKVLVLCVLCCQAITALNWCDILIYSYFYSTFCLLKVLMNKITKKILVHVKPTFDLVLNKTPIENHELYELLRIILKI